MGVEYGALNRYSSYGQPSLDLVFTGPKKSLRNRLGNQQVEFTRGSTATYTDENGIIRTAAQNEARFDHDSDGNSLGLLIEESRTNVITYSTAPDAQFNQDSANFSYTFNQPAPDGTSTAHLLVNTSNTSNNRGGYFVNSATIPTTGKIVVSVFVKPVGEQVIHLGGDPSNNGYYGVPMVSYNFTTSPPTANIGSTQYGYTVEPSIQNAGNGWYRLIEVIDLTNATAFNNGQTRGPRVANVTPGTSTYVWGYQIETGSFPTSYIPTSGSTVTRSADVASMTGTNFSSWYSQSQGTFTLKTSALKSGAGGSILLGGIYGSGYGEIEIFNNITEVWFIDYLNSPFRKISHDVSVGENRISGSYDNQTAQAIAVNGTVSTTSQNFSIGTNIITGITLMYRNPASLQTTGHLSRLTYYPVRLPDATLEALTT